MNDKEAYQQAKRRVKLKREFKTHLAVYAGVILLLLIINLSTASDNLWVKWPAFGWGIGLFFHALNAYVFPDKDTITDEMVRKEMEETDYL